ncbi:lipopolysaccharide heptosyltransferase family protein [Nonlabens ponticola]|uniref:Lipopolysaccharide heptosyltransferase family protein n=2 Tax=Nonlabens ponticola TaxID=2496866 RepID=A0A3S9N1J6_9FLAO|nr:lipopolysaccharide heptosyltransferase family protein [Nonlabens ponticola]
MLGDVLTSTVVADELKRSNPNAIVDYLIVHNAVPVVQGHPAIDNLILVKPQEFSSLAGIITLSRKLNNNKYTHIFDAYSKNNSGFLCSLLKAEHKIGYDKWFGFLAYQEKVSDQADKQQFPSGWAIGSRLRLLEPITDDIDYSVKPRIHLTETEVESGKQWLEQSGAQLDKSITMISVLGSSEVKTLPFATMAQLLNHLVEKTNTQIFFNYIPSQKDDAFAIYHLCKPQTREHILIDDFTASLRDFLKVLANCTAIIGNEGGAINMAKALDIPSFSIYSPWVPQEAWNISEDGEQHLSVHLKDLKPELYGDKKPAAFKSNSLEMYQNFDAGLIIKSLDQFIQYHY